MKCRICGCEAPAGAKLCKDCAAARKRAFAATVTQPLLLAAAGAPSVSQPRFSLRPAKPTRKPNPTSRGEPAPVRPSPAPKARPTERGPVSPAISPVTPAAAAVRQALTPLRQGAPRRVHFRSTLPWLAGAAGIAFVAVVLAIMVAQRRNHAPTDDAVPSPSVSVPSTPSGPNAPLPEAVTSLPSVVPPSDVEGVALPAAKPAPPKARRKAAAQDTVKVPAPESKPAVVAEPAPRNVAAPQPVMDRARVDPLQVLNDMLARCAREDMINRPGCEQRARSQSCGNWWGQIPQCPIGPGTDHGQ